MWLVNPDRQMSTSLDDINTVNFSAVQKKLEQRWQRCRPEIISKYKQKVRGKTGGIRICDREEWVHLPQHGACECTRERRPKRVFGRAQCRSCLAYRRSKTHADAQP